MAAILIILFLTVEYAYTLINTHADTKPDSTTDCQPASKVCQN